MMRNDQDYELNQLLRKRQLQFATATNVSRQLDEHTKQHTNWRNLLKPIFVHR